MATPAHVGSIDALKQLRVALVKFAETANVALGDAESDIQRTIGWLQHDQTSHWANEFRKRQQELVKAKEALRHKQVFKSPTGGRQGTADEEKAVAVAIRRMEEADQKMAAVKKWGPQLEKEYHVYKGSVQRLGSAVAGDIPNAVAKLNRMVMALEGYVNLGAPTEAASTAEPSSGQTMARAEAGVPGPSEAWRALRERSPAPPSRAALPPGDPLRGTWPLRIPASHVQTLLGLPLPRMLSDPAAMVAYAEGVWDHPAIYAHRTVPAFPGDSGWTLAPKAAASGQKFETAPVRDILNAWPAFADLLLLPAGMLIVLDSAGVVAVLDANDRDVWPR